MELYKGNTKLLIKNITLIVVGTLVLAFGTAVFIIPFELVVGGVSGFSIVVNRITGGKLSVDLLITLFTWALFFLGIFTLGKGFALKTLLSSIIYPIGISLFGRLADGGFLRLSESAYPQLAVLLSALFGGVLVGTGCALTFLGGGSTGGVDIIAFSVCKIFKRLKSSLAIFIIDSTAVLLGMFVIGDVVLTMLGIISALVSATAVDKIFLGGSRAFAAQVVSDRYAEINQAIIERLKRTTTLIDVVGGYSGKPKKMLSVSFSYTQYSELVKIVSSIDRAAFVTIHRAHEIGGEGWKELK